MRKQRALVTGSCGLIGSEVAIFFPRNGFEIAEVDSNHRREFFGREGDTAWPLGRLRREILATGMSTLISETAAKSACRQLPTISRWKQRFVEEGLEGLDTYHPRPQTVVLHQLCELRSWR